MKELGFNYWDGMEFFGFDTKKIRRLEGDKPRCCDRFRSWDSILVSIVLFSVFLAVMLNEGLYWLNGEIKTQ